MFVFCFCIYTKSKANSNIGCSNFLNFLSPAIRLDRQFLTNVISYAERIMVILPKVSTFKKGRAMPNVLSPPVRTRHSPGPISSIEDVLAYQHPALVSKFEDKLG